MGRTKKSVKNVKFMTISKVLSILLKFVIRTFFIRYLGTEYLGINGLFTNILTILSFAELGIGEAIIFKLYKPIAENDYERVKMLLHFYKKVYCIIGITILAFGLAILPFLNYLVGNDIVITDNIYLIFLLFLLDTSISYFFTYKRSIIIGNQDSYLISVIELIINIITAIIQVIMLMVIHNYIIFLVIQIIATIITNYIISLAAKKKYNYISEKNYKTIAKEDKKNIFNDVKSILLYKIGYVLSNGTDNIIISYFLGVTSVGLLSNYTIITSGIRTLISSAFNSLTGSIGNLNTIKDSSHKEKVFYEILYLSFINYGIISICISLLINKFITIWLGKQYLLSFAICIALGFDFYVDGMRFVNYSFRNTLGLFKKGRYIPLISSISNVILSIILVRYIGMFGVLIATGLTRLFILTLYDPYLIHKNEFKTSCKKFYLKYFYYLTITAFAFIICLYMNKFIHISGILGFVICGLLDVIIIIIIYIISTHRLSEFNSLKERFLRRG